MKKDYGKVIEPKIYTLEKLGFCYFLRNSLSLSRQEKEEKILFSFQMCNILK